MAFKGKVALITGAGSGMGQLYARRLAESGARVAALDVNEAGLKDTASSSKNIRAYTCDVSNTDEVFKTVEKIETELGEIDRAVSAAAIMPSSWIKDQDAKLIHKVMDVNYGGVVNITKATLPGMLKRGKGDQIMFGSLVGWLPTMHFGSYCASKAATIMYAEILYHENHTSGVRFACVCPPMVATPLLKQVTSNPKTMNMRKPIEPKIVLDEIEKCLEKGKFWVYPGGETRWVVLARRLVPEGIWKNMHKIEGM